MALTNSVLTQVCYTLNNPDNPDITHCDNPTSYDDGFEQILF